MVVTKNRFPSAATREDLLQASKAIHDEVLEVMDSKVKILEDGFSDHIVKLIGTRYSNEEQLDGRLWKMFDTRLRKEFDERLESEVNRRMEIMDKKHREEIVAIKSLHLELVEQIKTMYWDRFDAFQQAREEMMSELKGFLKSFPQVNVTLPEQKSADIVVNVPRQEVPIMNFQVPEQKTPIVQLQQAPPRTVTKSIAYDSTGRPSIITEKEV